MKNAVDTIKQLRPATVIAILALFVAVGGTATAASGLINGKNIKNNTVTGKKLKNKTITKNKLAPKTIKALKGQKGAQGPQGNQGDPGADGVVSPLYTDSGSVNVPADTELGITTLNVPAGRYIVTANVSITTNATNSVSCGVSANNSGGENSSTYDNDGGGRTTIPVQFVTENANVTAITLGCAAGNQIAGVSGDILAIPVQ
ncbi:MAG: hypothetical protein QG596_62 [Actinomycetota bacterium]|nr:hypothetical protein [Actinomycetota bacterium]